MREKQVEQKLVRAAGGMCPKFVSPGMAGMPDWLILLPGGPVCLCRGEGPGQKSRPLQVRWHEQLRKLWFFFILLRFF